MKKIEQKKTLKRLRSAARSILSNRYGVSRFYTERLDSLCRYIHQARSEEHLRGLHGYALVSAFLSLHQSTKKIEPASNEFLQSYEWRRLRMKILTERGAICECCGATARHGVRLNVDHIKPRRLFPKLALDERNLQVLCEDCNHGKGNEIKDWRGR